MYVIYYAEMPNSDWLFQKHRQNSDQVFRYHSYSLHTAEGASAAIEAECKANNGRAPDAFFLCAGTSRPYFWVENTSEDLINGMNQAYWVQAWPAHVYLSFHLLLEIHGLT